MTLTKVVIGEVDRRAAEAGHDALVRRPVLMISLREE